MVGHQAVCIDRDVVLLTISGQAFQVDLVIAATEKGLLSLVSADDDVIEKAGSKDPGATSHRQLLTRVFEDCQYIHA
jgi:hypothetical protein